MMSFNYFVYKHDSKNKATSNIKIYQGLDNVDIYVRDGPFSSDIGIINLHPSKRTYWVLYIHECYLDSYGITPSKKQSKFIIKRYGHCLYSEYKWPGLISKKDIYCASYCFYIIYLLEVIAIDFKSAVLN